MRAPLLATFLIIASLTAAQTAHALVGRSGESSIASKYGYYTQWSEGQDCSAGSVCLTRQAWLGTPGAGHRDELRLGVAARSVPEAQLAALPSFPRMATFGGGSERELIAEYDAFVRMHISPFATGFAAWLRKYGTGVGTADLYQRISHRGKAKRLVVTVLAFDNGNYHYNGAQIEADSAVTLAEERIVYGRVAPELADPMASPWPAAVAGRLDYETRRVNDLGDPQPVSSSHVGDQVAEARAVPGATRDPVAGLRCLIRRTAGCPAGPYTDVVTMIGQQDARYAVIDYHRRVAVDRVQDGTEYVGRLRYANISNREFVSACGANEYRQNFAWSFFEKRTIDRYIVWRDGQHFLINRFDNIVNGPDNSVAMRQATSEPVTAFRAADPRMLDHFGTRFVNASWYRPNVLTIGPVIETVDNSACAADVCSNLPGVQATLPSALIPSGSACVCGNGNTPRMESGNWTCTAPAAFYNVALDVIGNGSIVFTSGGSGGCTHLSCPANFSVAEGAVVDVLGGASAGWFLGGIVHSNGTPFTPTALGPAGLNVRAVFCQNGETYSNGACFASAVDFCTNLPGNQTAIPPGMSESGGVCTCNNSGTPFGSGDAISCSVPTPTASCVITSPAVCAAGTISWAYQATNSVMDIPHIDGGYRGIVSGDSRPTPSNRSGTVTSSGWGNGTFSTLMYVSANTSNGSDGTWSTCSPGTVTCSPAAPTAHTVTINVVGAGELSTNQGIHCWGPEAGLAPQCPRIFNVLSGTSIDFYAGAGQPGWSYGGMVTATNPEIITGNITKTVYYCRTGETWNGSGCVPPASATVLIDVLGEGEIGTSQGSNCTRFSSSSTCSRTFAMPIGGSVTFFAAPAAGWDFIGFTAPATQTVAAGGTSNMAVFCRAGWSYTGGVCVPPPSSDVCANLAGIQLSVPAGLVQSGANCVCPNASFSLTDTGNGTYTCTPPPPVDLCSNIAGNQSFVPAGMTASGGICLCSNGGTPVGSGDAVSCSAPPTASCSITSPAVCGGGTITWGYQATDSVMDIPHIDGGYRGIVSGDSRPAPQTRFGTVASSGWSDGTYSTLMYVSANTSNGSDGSWSTCSPGTVTCSSLLPPPDNCPNLAGVQPLVPAGLILSGPNCLCADSSQPNDNGDGTYGCPALPPPPPMDLCTNLDGLQTSVAAGMNRDAFGNCACANGAFASADGSGGFVCDSCVNVAGIQWTVPATVTRIGEGNCSCNNGSIPQDSGTGSVVCPCNCPTWEAGVTGGPGVCSRSRPQTCPADRPLGTWTFTSQLNFSTCQWGPEAEDFGCRAPLCSSDEIWNSATGTCVDQRCPYGEAGNRAAGTCTPVPLTAGVINQCGPKGSVPDPTMAFSTNISANGVDGTLDLYWAVSTSPSGLTSEIYPSSGTRSWRWVPAVGGGAWQQLSSNTLTSEPGFVCPEPGSWNVGYSR
jgi:hypothetical protein